MQLLLEKAHCKVPCESGAASVTRNIGLILQDHAGAAGIGSSSDYVLQDMQSLLQCHDEASASQRFTDDYVSYDEQFDCV